MIQRVDRKGGCFLFTRNAIFKNKFVTNNTKKSTASLAVICFLFASLISIPAAMATSVAATDTVSISDSVSIRPSVSWSAASYSPGDAPAGSVVKNVITVKDLTARGSGAILVLVKSHRSPIGTQITLNETPPNSGTFKNTNIIFTNGTGEIPLGNLGYTKVSISVINQDANCDPATAETIPSTTCSGGDTLPIKIYSSSYLTGITPKFTETGPNTGIFSADVTLTTAPSGGNSLHVSQGDEISVLDENSGITTNFLVTPNPAPAIGDISVFTIGGDVVTASYKGVSASAIITDDSCPGCGGGSGGIIANAGIVVDFIGNVVGGSYTSHPSLVTTLSSLPQSLLNAIGFNPSKPIPPSTLSSINYPLIINGKGYLLVSSANTLVTDIEETGKTIPIEFHFHTNGIPITHVSLFEDKGQYGNIQESDTAIIYDRDHLLQIIDPHGYFGNVTVLQHQNEFTANFTFNIIFSKPMPKSDLFVRVWNQQLASQDIAMFDALQVVSNPQVSNQNSTKTLAGSLSNHTVTNNTNQPLSNQNATGSGKTNSDTMTAIKEWGGYSPQSISDSQLLGSLGMQGLHIPSWVMKTTKFVVNGDIDEQDFVNIIKYLNGNGIIK